jgi:hypothetical protein
MIYVFYTGLNVTDNYIYRETKEELDKHDVFKNVTLVKGEVFDFESIKYKILDMYPHYDKSGHQEGLNVLCEVIE